MFEERKTEPASGSLKDWTTGEVDLLDPSGKPVDRLKVWGFTDAPAVRPEAGAAKLARNICERHAPRLKELGAGPGWQIRFTDKLTVVIGEHWGVGRS